MSKQTDLGLFDMYQKCRKKIFKRDDVHKMDLVRFDYHSQKDLYPETLIST